MPRGVSAGRDLHAGRGRVGLRRLSRRGSVFFWAASAFVFVAPVSLVAVYDRVWPASLQGAWHGRGFDPAFLYFLDDREGAGGSFAVLCWTQPSADGRWHRPSMDVDRKRLAPRDCADDVSQRLFLSRIGLPR